MYNSVIVKQWLSVIGLRDYKIISSDDFSDVTIITDNGVIGVIVDAERIDSTYMTATAVSSFSWNCMVNMLDSLDRILPYITVHRWGWLYESCNSVLLKVFLNIFNTEIYINGYNIRKLHDPCFVRFVENCCDMQINVKVLQDHTINRSIMFSVPVDNPLLQSTMIKSKEDLFQCLKRE